MKKILLLFLVLALSLSADQFTQRMWSGGFNSHSLDFETDSNHGLSMSDANFGAFDHGKFAVVCFWNRESLTGDEFIMVAKDDLSTKRALIFILQTDHKFAFAGYDGTSAIGALVTTNTYSSTNNWQMAMGHFDKDNATPDDRIKLWIDGTQMTVFETRINPSVPIDDSDQLVEIGMVSNTRHIDGKLAQVAFFSGTLPSISDVYDSTTGGPKNLEGLPGLWSYIKGVNGPLVDEVLSSDWTDQNGGPTLSTDVPP